MNLLIHHQYHSHPYTLTKINVTNEKSYVALTKLKNNSVEKKNPMMHNINCLCDRIILSTTITWILFVPEIYYYFYLQEKGENNGEFY